MPKVKSALCKPTEDQIIKSHHDEICNVLSKSDDTLLQFADELYKRKIISAHTKNFAIARKGYGAACVLIDEVELKVQEIPTRFQIVLKIMKGLDEMKVISTKMSNRKSRGRSVSPTRDFSSSNNEEAKDASDFDQGECLSVLYTIAVYMYDTIVA